MNISIDNRFLDITNNYVQDIEKVSHDDEKLSQKTPEPKENYSHEDAVMDLEAIKRYLYMLVGMEYVPRDEFGYEKRSEIWA